MDYMKEILAKAIEILETKGWGQRVLSEGSGETEFEMLQAEDACSFCMMGAIQRASMDLGFSVYHSADVFKHLYRLNNFDSLAKFNDAPERTKEEVIEVLRKAMS